MAEDDIANLEDQPVIESQTQYDSPTEYECWVTEEAFKHRLGQGNEAREQEDEEQLGGLVSISIKSTSADQYDNSGPASVMESQTQYDSPTEYEHWVAEEAFKCRLAQENKIRDREEKDQSHFEKQSLDDGNLISTFADDPEHPVAGFLSIFLSPEFVMPKRPGHKFTTIQELMTEQKLFNINVVLCEIMPDSQGESLEQYGKDLVSLFLSSVSYSNRVMLVISRWAFSTVRQV